MWWWSSFCKILSWSILPFLVTLVMCVFEQKLVAFIFFFFFYKKGRTLFKMSCMRNTSIKRWWSGRKKAHGKRRLHKTKNNRSYLRGTKSRVEINEISCFHDISSLQNFDTIHESFLLFHLRLLLFFFLFHSPYSYISL